MAKIRPFKVVVGEGIAVQEVRYSAKERPESDFLQVVFNDASGKVIRKGTTGVLRGGTPDGQFHNDAAGHIVQAFQCLFPTSAKKKWDDALEEAVVTCAARPDTVRAFRTAVKVVKEFLPAVGCPADVTERDAQRFARLFLTTPYSRGSSRVQRKRTPVTLSYYIRSLSALYRHFRELGSVGTNPWKEVTIPKAEKKEKYVPTEEHISGFFNWIHARYPKWERLHALLLLKLASACRTRDVVQLRSDQIQKTTEGGKLVFDAAQTKTKTERHVPLPKSLYEQLQKVKGRVWLWDGWNDDLRAFRPGRNPIPTTYKAATVQNVLENIFREYSDSQPDVPRLSPHDFRRRTITLMVTKTQSVDVTAQALGLNPQTARAHYLDAQRAFNTADAFKLVEGALLPKIGDKPE